MHTIVIAVGSYGYMHTVECSSQELVAISAVLMRSQPVRDNYRGGFEIKEENSDSRMTVTVVKPSTITSPESTEE